MRRLQVEATGRDSTLLPPMTSILIITEAVKNRERVRMRTQGALSTLGHTTGT